MNAEWCSNLLSDLAENDDLISDKMQKLIKIGQSAKSLNFDSTIHCSNTFPSLKSSLTCTI